MAMTIHHRSHLDHGIPKEAIDFIVERYSHCNEFFIDTFDLPSHFEMMPVGIAGPNVGDAPVPEREVFYVVRPGRKWASRMTWASWRKGPRLTRQVTVIAGPRGNEKCSLYTAYPGPPAPREPGDPSISKWSELLNARDFWSKHALIATK